MWVPQNQWFIRGNPIEMDDDQGYPHDSGNPQMSAEDWDPNCHRKRFSRDLEGYPGLCIEKLGDAYTISGAMNSRHSSDRKENVD